MKSWEIAIQHLLDGIDAHVIENPSLSEISTSSLISLPAGWLKIMNATTRKDWAIRF